MDKASAPRLEQPTARRLAERQRLARLRVSDAGRLQQLAGRAVRLDPEGARAHRVRTGLGVGGAAGAGVGVGADLARHGGLPALRSGVAVRGG